MLKKDADKPPKFAISNGWCIGEMPHNLVNDDMNDVFVSSVARIRTFLNVYLKKLLNVCLKFS